jgi:co-chaperonin GroES (HSP10)
MNIRPVNNWLRVTPEEQDQDQDSLVLLPDDYKKAESPYTIVRVIYSSNSYCTGNILIVPTHTIQDIEVRGDIVHLVQENYVLAVIE